MGIFWTIAIGIFYLMALGPEVMVGDKSTGVPMPYSLLQYLPVFSIGRDPGRFQTIAMLGIGLLTAFGLRFIFDGISKLPSHNSLTANLIRNRTWVTRGISSLFLVVALGGFMLSAGTAKADPPDWPPFYQEIGRDSETYAVLELPLFTENGRGENHYMMFQLLHNKPRFSGRLARDHKLNNPNNIVTHSGFFRRFWLADAPSKDITLYYPEQDFLDRTNYSTYGVSILNYYNVRYIILYKEAVKPEDSSKFTDLIEQVLGSGVQPVYEDKLMVAYKVPRVSSPLNPLTLDVGNGWFPSAVGEKDNIYRWANNMEGQSSELYAMNLTHELAQTTLSFKAYTYKNPRTLKVSLKWLRSRNHTFEAGRGCQSNKGLPEYTSRQQCDHIYQSRAIGPY